MKEKVIKILSEISKFIPLDALIKISKQKHIFPFYHVVSDNPPVYVKNLYPVRSEKQFIKDIDFYLKNYKAESFKNIEKIFLKKMERSFFLSFDDGLSEFYNIVAPILKKKGVPATVFINSDFVDNKNIFRNFKVPIFFEYYHKSSKSQKKEVEKIFNKFLKIPYKTFENLIFNEKIETKLCDILDLNFDEYLKKNQPYLTSNQIKELIADGFTIGSHSINHPLYSKISVEEQIYQTVKSVEFLRKNFGIKTIFFAFPFTDTGINKYFFKYLNGNNITDFTFGTSGIKDDFIKNNIQRIAIEKTNMPAEKYVKTQYLMYIIKKIFGKNTVKRF